MPLSSQSKMGSHFNLFSICSEANSTCYSPPKLANQNAQKAPLICEYVLMKVIFGWLMAISFSCILASICVTSSPPVAIYHLVRNVHTLWMIPSITLKTLHILLVIIWHSANLENVPLSSSSLQKSQYVLKLFIFSLPDHIEYNSLTAQFTRLYILISALVLVFGYTGISGHCWLLLVQSHVQYNGVKFATPYSHATW